MSDTAFLAFFDGGMEPATRPVFRPKGGAGADRQSSMEYSDLLNLGYRQVDPDSLPDGASVYAVKNGSNGGRWTLATLRKRA